MMTLNEDRIIFSYDITDRRSISQYVVTSVSLATPECLVGKNLRED